MIRALAIGDRIDDRFRIARPLGKGGYGSVVVALDEASDTEIALKLIPAPADARARRRFEGECAALQALAHEGLPRFVASGAHDGGVHYVAMELVEAPTLADMLAADDTRDFAYAISVTDQVLTALDAMHRAGIVHRDVKPSNILLALVGDVERVVLVDFGLATTARVDLSWSRPTRSGTVVGTAGYLAPERIEGARGDERADVWAVGVVLFEMLAGRQPFRGKSPTRTMLQTLTSAVPPLPDDVPHRDAVAAIVATALEKSSARRYASAAVFRDALRALPSIGTPRAPRRS